jgi:hypothetical protein
MKNRTREICTSGTVRDEGGNILIYSAARERGGDVAVLGACAAAGDAGDRNSRSICSRMQAFSVMLSFKIASGSMRFSR